MLDVQRLKSVLRVNIFLHAAVFKRCKPSGSNTLEFLKGISSNKLQAHSQNVVLIDKWSYNSAYLKAINSD